MNPDKFPNQEGGADDQLDREELGEPIEEQEDAPDNLFEKKTEISNQEIKDLEQPIEKILGDFWVDYYAKELDLVIGDDASGRVPALVFSNFFKKIAPMAGRKKPELKTVFVAGGTRDIFDKERLAKIKQEKKEEIKKLVEKQAEAIGEDLKKMRVLIVTDLIYHGETLEPITETLKELGISFSIATIALSNEHAKHELEEKFGGTITYGGKGIPSIWRKYRLAGVVRQGYAGEIHGRPIKHDDDSEAHKKLVQEYINSSREDITILTEKLVEKYAQNRHFFPRVRNY